MPYDVIKCATFWMVAGGWALPIGDSTWCGNERGSIGWSSGVDDGAAAGVFVPIGTVMFLEDCVGSVMPKFLAMMLTSQQRLELWMR